MIFLESKTFSDSLGFKNDVFLIQEGAAYSSTNIRSALYYWFKHKLYLLIYFLFLKLC